MINKYSYPRPLFSASRHTQVDFYADSAYENYFSPCYENRQDHNDGNHSVMLLDDVGRGAFLARHIQKKPSLHRWYQENYDKYRKVLEHAPDSGIVLELGSGGGFLKDVVPAVLTSDILPYEGVDQIVDATKMPFKDGELRAIFMLNVLHHIPDAEIFFSEAARCLKPGGRILIVDQYPGFISKFILKYFHHEPFNESAEQWKFESTGPLSGANGALAWIVFFRDISMFQKKFPTLSVNKIETHTPLRYWLCGGLKAWSVLPNRLYGMATWLDQILIRLSPKWGSFLDIELVRKAE